MNPTECKYHSFHLVLVLAVENGVLKVKKEENLMVPPKEGLEKQ